MDRIEVLRGAERVRRRAAMIFGAADYRGAIRALVNVCEALLSESEGLEATLTRDGGIRLDSRDRGLVLGEGERGRWYDVFCALHPASAYPEYNVEKSLFEPSEDDGGWISESAFDLGCTQCASEYMTVEACRDGFKTTVRFENGEPVSLPEKVPYVGRTGTRIAFKPDGKVFRGIDKWQENAEHILCEMGVRCTRIDKIAIVESLGDAARLEMGHEDAEHEVQEMTRGEWLLENAPFISTPDSLLDRVYTFRWQNLLSSLSKRRADGKWEICESAPDSCYHKYIDCAEGAHIREARWIRDKKYLNDHIDLVPPREAYWSYLIDSVLQKYFLDGDKSVIERNYEKLCARFSSRDSSFDEEMGLYYLTGDSEGQEAGVGAFDSVEREMVYSASYSAEGHGVEALFDNDTENEYWSTAGSPDSVNTVSITLPFPDCFVTGVRLWFKNEPRSISVTAFCGGEKIELSIVGEFSADPLGRCVLSLEKTHVERLELAFESESGAPVEVYEAVVEYNFEPWGSVSFWKVIGGERSARVCANSFMASAAAALGEMARILGKEADVAAWKEKSERLKDRILDHLWDGDKHFFTERLWKGERVVGLESSALAPFCFGLVPDSAEYGEAWRYALDEKHFLSPFGLTSLERCSPHYMQPFTHGCLWNGPVWPYTFSLVLTGMWRCLDGDVPYDARDCYELLHRYCLCHFDNYSDSRLEVREDHHPEENRWLAQAAGYNHSTFIDTVLEGLFGIRPDSDGLTVFPRVPEKWERFDVEGVAWRGHLVDLHFDSESFRVMLDGKEIHRSKRVEAVRIGEKN